MPDPDTSPPLELQIARERLNVLLNGLNTADPGVLSLLKVLCSMTLSALMEALRVESIKNSEAAYLLIAVGHQCDDFKDKCPEFYYAGLRSAESTISAMLEAATPVPVTLGQPRRNIDA